MNIPEVSAQVQSILDQHELGKDMSVLTGGIYTEGDGHWWIPVEHPRDLRKSEAYYDLFAEVEEALAKNRIDASLISVHAD